MANRQINNSLPTRYLFILIAFTVSDDHETTIRSTFTCQHTGFIRAHFPIPCSYHRTTGVIGYYSLATTVCAPRDTVFRWNKRWRPGRSGSLCQSTAHLLAFLTFSHAMERTKPISSPFSTKGTNSSRSRRRKCAPPLTPRARTVSLYVITHLLDSWKCYHRLPVSARHPLVRHSGLGIPIRHLLLVVRSTTASNSNR